MPCNHKREASYWVNDYEDDYGTVVDGHWEYKTESTTVDLDTHRYKCVECNEILYYSAAAKEYHQTGVDRKGLFS